MLSSNEIRNVGFSKSVGGYKQEEVDIFLDKIEADYIAYENSTNEFRLKIEALNNEIEDHKKSQSSLQNVLLSAQRLADEILAEAKLKSDAMISEAKASVEDITTRAKQLNENLDAELVAKKAAAEAEIVSMLETAKKKADAVTLASADSVARQQAVFDKMKAEISEFKASVMALYKEHLELLKDMPTTVSMEPKKVAEILSEEIEKDTEVEAIPQEEVEEPVAIEQEQPIEELSEPSEERFIVQEDFDEE